MAKRNSTRRAARKPKIIDVEGHQLTAAMHADYERCLESRSTVDLTSRSDGAARILQLGLADFLGGYRPSHKAKLQIQEIYLTASRVGLAVAAMGDYPFFTDAGAVRSGGCDLLKKLALDLYRESAKLTSIANAVEAENSTKLQDWLAQAEGLEQLGSSKEFAHGNL